MARDVPRQLDYAQLLRDMGDRVRSLEGRIGNLEQLIAEQTFAGLPLTTRTVVAYEANAVIAGTSQLAGAGLAYNPTKLEAWYKANDPASISEASGLVTQWNDKSGHGRHVLGSGGATTQPSTGSTINGKNAIAFSLTDHALAWSGSSFTVGTIYLAVQLESLIVSSYHNILSGDGNNKEVPAIAGAGGSPPHQNVVYLYDGGTQEAGKYAPYVLGTTYIIRIVVNGANSFLGLNGVNGGAYTLNWSTTTALTFGHGTQPTPVMRLGEALVFNDVHDLAQSAPFLDYLAREWRGAPLPVPLTGTATILGIGTVAATGAKITPIAHDASTAGGVATTGTILTFGHTIGGGASRLLVVGAILEGTGLSVSGATYNGVGMVQVDQDSNGTTAKTTAALFRMDDSALPAAGTYNIVITVTGGTLDGAVGQLLGAATSVTNAAQGAPEASNKSNSGAGSTTHSTGLTVLTNGAWVFDVITGNNPGTWAPDAGQTERTDQSTALGGGNSGATSTKLVATAGATTVGWTASTSMARRAHVLAAWAPAVL